MTRPRRLLLGIALLAAAGLLLRYDAGGPRWTVHSSHALGARTATFADGGRLLVTVPHDPGVWEKWAGPVEVRETATGRLVHSCWDGETITALGFSKDGRRVAVVSARNEVRGADTFTGETWRHRLPAADFCQVDFSPSGEKVFIAGPERRGGITEHDLVSVHDTRDGRQTGLLAANNHSGLAFANGMLVFLRPEKGLVLWDLATHKEISRIEDATQIRVSRDGWTLLTRNGGRATTWDLKDPKRPTLRATLPLPDDHDVHLSADGAVVITLPEPQVVPGQRRGWDAHTGRLLWSAPYPRFRTEAEVASVDRLILYTWGTRDPLRGIDVATGEEKWKGDGAHLLPGGYPAGRLFLGSGGRYALADLKTGERTECHIPPLDNFASFRFTSDATLWFQAVIKPQPSPSWLPVWLAPTPEGHQRLYAINADGRPTFTLAGRDLCGYLPLDDGSAVVTFHQHDGAQRMSLHDARHAPVWPRVAAALLGLAGVALLLAALWPKRGVTPARGGPASGSP